MFLVWKGEAGVEEVRDDLLQLSHKGNKREFEVYVSGLRKANAHSEVATLQDSS
jgi:hypothetical protein